MPELKIDQLFHVEIIEHEKNKGQKVIENKFFDCEEDAKTFVSNFNSKNDYSNPPPRWYTIALYCGKIA